VDPTISRYIEAASGVTALTRANAERLARQLARQGEVAGDQVNGLVTELMERSRKNRELLVTLVSSEVQRAVRTMGLATNDEVTALRRQVADLEREVVEARRRAAGSDGG
jgi:polyhydroxyalkanoate synthesis regulator phasin